MDRTPKLPIHTADIIDWLKTSPLEEEIRYNERQKKFMEFRVIKAKLDKLCPESWDTKNFHHFFFYDQNKRLRVSGNIEVVIKYIYELPDGSGIREVYRALAGAATFFPDEYVPNEHWGATCKTLCIANAVQALGEQFGWGLNDDLEDIEPDVFSPPIPKKTTEMIRKGVVSTKVPPDKEIRKKYAEAASKGDFKKIEELEAIYAFQIE